MEELKNNTCCFTISTTHHGTIEFASLSLWRDTKIIFKLLNESNLKADKYVAVIAKYCIQKIDRTKILSEEDFDKLEKKQILFSNKEIKDFSFQFLEKNKFLTGQIDDNIKISFDDGELISQELDEKLINYNWDKSIVKKLKQAWILHIEEELRFIKKTIGFFNLPDFELLSKLAHTQDELFTKLEVFNDKKSEDINTSSTNLQIDNELVSAFRLEKQLLENICALQQKTNEYVEKQTEENKKNVEKQITEIKNQSERQFNQAVKSSKSSSYLSIVAIIIASIGVISSSIVGIWQCVTNSNDDTSQLLKNIIIEEKEIKNTIYEEVMKINSNMDELIIYDYNDELETISANLKASNKKLDSIYGKLKDNNPKIDNKQ